MASVGALTSLEGYSGVCSMTERDAPKAGRSGDRFDRTAFAQGLANLLYDAGKQKATGLVVGLTGPWGSGKSQTLLYVKEIPRRTGRFRNPFW